MSGRGRQDDKSITQFVDLKTVFDKLLLHADSNRKVHILHSRSIFHPDSLSNYPDIKCRHMMQFYEQQSLLFDAENDECANKESTIGKHTPENVSETDLEITTGDISFERISELENSYTEEKVSDVLKVLTAAATEINTKLKIIEWLVEICSTGKMPINLIITNDLLHYSQKLLFAYSNMLSNNKKVVKNIETAELTLMVPLLMLLKFSQNMTVENIRSAYIYRSYVMLELMQAITHCFHSAAEMGNGIHNYTSGKIVISAANKMAHKDTVNAFGNCYGFFIQSKKFHITGYKVILFDTLNNSCSSRDVSEHLLRVKMDVMSSVKANSGCSFSYEDAEWISLVVARLLPLNYMLGYTELMWKEHLLHMSGQIHIFLTESHQHESMQQKMCEEGDVVGFRCVDATFDGHPLLAVQCLRGYVLAVTGNCLMMWAMDIGLLCYTSQSFVKHLPASSGFDKPALIKFCELQGVECNFNENFFLHASQLLLVLLKNNSQTGKHILLSDKGESILCLLEHPGFHVRIRVLDILLCLAGNCQEICTFIEKKAVDKCLVGKLERYAHAYASHMHKDRRLFNVETLVLTKVLSTILDSKKDVEYWPSSTQAVRALRILYDIPDISWKKIIDKCLQQLRHRVRRGNMIRQRARNVKDGSHNTRLPRNNTLCEYNFQKFDTVLSKSETSEPPLDIQTGGEQKVLLKSNSDYYILGSKVDITADQSHELMEQITLDDLKELQLAEVLCGLLNNNAESTMYFGLSKQSIVTGIVLHREDKDVFRNGIDRIMSKCLLPEVRADSYEVLFTPVLKPGDKPVDISKIHLYVIEVRVHPLMHMAYVVYQGRRCFMRQDTSTVEWTVTQKKNYMMEQEERILDDSIEKLNEDTRNNLHLLANLMQKYVMDNN
ncbi:uncharacterized protein LOC126262308 [Schistocerca nitens]|uniref:uncharacterized protein LOC126262308 n=1 Tax=Schistocerca nitens TaxID=7011 RepID=UPI00211816E7|nr:uncharacterized protein LOC126262308 [Schistocerca nitens]